MTSCPTYYYCLLLLIVFSLDAADSVRCFTCQGTLGGGDTCDVVTDITPAFNCLDSEECMVFSYVPGDLATIIVRDCATTANCVDNLPLKAFPLDFCSTCQGDRCNNQNLNE